MENTPLNEAHIASRKAGKCLRTGRLVEAGEHHTKAANLLETLEKSLEEDSLCKRSLVEQVKFHRKQVQFVEILRELWEKNPDFWKMSSKIPSFSPTERRKVLQPVSGNANQPLPPAIRRNLDEADSLLRMLQDQKYLSFRELQKAQSVDETNRVEFAIRPKNDSDVIEELQTVNSKLRALVDQLLNELNESREENKHLERRLAKEQEKNSILLSQQKSSSSSLDTSRFDISNDPKKSVLISMNIPGTTSTIDIPELDPLEVPEFDFSTFSQSAQPEINNLE